MKKKDSAEVLLLKKQIARLEKQNSQLQQEKLRFERKSVEDSWRGQVDCESGAFRQDEIDAAIAW